MRILRPQQGAFRYAADPVCVTACLLYVANRLIVRHHDVGGFFTNYFNDLLLIPLFLPPALWIDRFLRFRPDDRPPTLAEIGLHWVIWSILFELVAPRLWFLRTYSDGWDVVAYAVGGAVAVLIWRMRASRRGAIPDVRAGALSESLMRPSEF